MLGGKFWDISFVFWLGVKKSVICLRRFPVLVWFTTITALVTFPGRSANALSFSGSVLQATVWGCDVLGRRLCPQAMFQASQHFRCFETQATCYDYLGIEERVPSWQALLITTGPRNHPTNGNRERESLSFASIILWVIVWISDRGVTHAIAHNIYYPRVTRISHTIFHLNRLIGWSAKRQLRQSQTAAAHSHSILYL